MTTISTRQAGVNPAAETFLTPSLRPRAAYILRWGDDLLPGAPVRTRSGRRGVYQHESTIRTVAQIIVNAKNQAVLIKPELFTLLLNSKNIGGMWLREQDDPKTVFERMWNELGEGKYKKAPKAAQVTVVGEVYRTIQNNPDINRAMLMKTFHALGWKNNGNNDDILKGLIRIGLLEDKCTMSASGNKCISRRFRATTDEDPEIIAVAINKDVSNSIQGYKSRFCPWVTKLSFADLLENKTLQNIGKRVQYNKIKSLLPKLEIPHVPETLNLELWTLLTVPLRT